MQQTKQKSRDLSSLQLCSSSSVKTWLKGRGKQRKGWRKAERGSSSSVSSCILYYKYVLHVKQNQETNVSPQRVKTWGQCRTEKRKRKYYQEREGRRREDKTQETRHKTNRLISPGREAVKRTDNYLRYAPQRRYISQHMLGIFQCVCIFAYKAFDFRMSVKSKCQIK